MTTDLAHRYYVSFARPTADGQKFAATQIALEKPVRSMADINLIRDILASAGYPDATVLSFSPFTDAHPEAS